MHKVTDLMSLNQGGVSNSDLPGCKAGAFPFMW